MADSRVGHIQGFCDAGYAHFLMGQQSQNANARGVAEYLEGVGHGLDVFFVLLSGEG